MTAMLLTRFVATLVFSFLLGFLLTKIVRKKLLEKAVMDIPNERSMHKIPTPRGGGLAVIAVTLGGLALSLAAEGAFFPYGWLLIGGALLVLVSWLDDKKGMGAGVRLLSHLAAAFLGTLAFTPDDMVFGGFLPLWLDRAITILGWAWFMNLYNFMDGIDGITGTETICLAIGASLLFSHLTLQDPVLYTLPALIAGASGGFLLLNWHPAKIFLGDVGSVPVGFLLGFLLLKIAVMGYLAAALILPLYYLADSGITITKRALRGEKIWQAHRQHFYQRATQGLGNPVRIVVMILLTNLALMDSARVAIDRPAIGLGLGLFATAALLFWMQKTSKA